MRIFLKKIIPHNLIKFTRKNINNIDYLLVLIFSKSKLLSSFYYFFSRDFEREYHSVINGRLMYYKNEKSNKLNAYKLRRNIHRIEKGLLMKPRRNIFALGFIEETVITFKNYSVNSEISDKELIKWSSDVLGEYFSVVENHPVIYQAKQIYENTLIRKGSNSDSIKRIPYKRDEHFKPVAYESLYELALYRRSVRWYKDKKVPRKEIDKAINLANLSPSACNRQPFEFRIFDDKNKIQQILKDPIGTTGYSENIPILVAVIGDLSAYFREIDRHLIYIDSSLAAMSFCYALETLSIGSCMINWPDRRDIDKHICKELNLHNNEKVIMLISLGYPDNEGLVAFSQKKSLDTIRRYD